MNSVSLKLTGHSTTANETDSNVRINDVKNRIRIFIHSIKYDKIYKDG